MFGNGIWAVRVSCHCCRGDRRARRAQQLYKGHFKASSNGAQRQPGQNPPGFCDPGPGQGSRGLGSSEELVKEELWPGPWGSLRLGGGLELLHLSAAYLLQKLSSSKSCPGEAHAHACERARTHTHPLQHLPGDRAGTVGQTYRLAHSGT